MKRFIPLIFIIMVIFSINMSKTYASQGCCSWHGGISHCGSNGKYVCNDGTYSPNCTCTSYELNDNYSYTENAIMCKEYRNTISELETKINELEEENEYLKKNSKTNENWLLILIFGIIGYVIYKFIKNNNA